MFSVVPSEKSLPDELTLEVLKHLSWRDLGQVASVNRYMHRVSLDNTLWRPFFKTCFSELSLNKEDQNPGGVKQRFRAEFFKIQKTIKAFEGNLPDEGLKRHYFYLLYQIEKEKEEDACKFGWEKFNDDEVFVKAFIKIDPFICFLSYLPSPRLLDDKPFALYSVATYPLSFSRFSSRLQKDKDLINTAFDNGYFPLQYDALKAYRDDLETIRRAVSVNIGNLKLASVAVRCNKAFIKSLIEEHHNSMILQMSHPYLWQDVDLQALALEFDPDYIKRCTYDLINNKDLMVRIVKKWIQVYPYTSLEHRNDIGFLLALVEDEPEIFNRLKESRHPYPKAFKRGVCDYMIHFKSLSALKKIKILLALGYVFDRFRLNNNYEIRFLSPACDKIIYTDSKIRPYYSIAPSMN